MFLLKQQTQDGKETIAIGDNVKKIVEHLFEYRDDIVFNLMNNESCLTVYYIGRDNTTKFNEFSKITGDDFSPFDDDKIHQTIMLNKIKDDLARTV
jgi:hypothetical protein